MQKHYIQLVTYSTRITQQTHEIYNPAYIKQVTYQCTYFTKKHTCEIHSLTFPNQNFKNCFVGRQTVALCSVRSTNPDGPRLHPQQKLTVNQSHIAHYQCAHRPSAQRAPPIARPPVMIDSLVGPIRWVTTTVKWITH